MRYLSCCRCGADISRSTAALTAILITSLSLFLVRELSGVAATGPESPRHLAHSHEVHAVAFSADGKLVGSASRDKTAKLWDSRTGELRHTLKHGEEVFGIAFSPDEKTVACGGENQLTLWNARTGEPVWKTAADETPGQNDSGRPKGAARSLAFGADGALLATAGGNDQAVRLWEVGSKTLRRTLSRAGATVSFSPDGKMIVCGDKREDGVQISKVTLWDAQTGTLQRTLAEAGPRILFAPDGKTLGSGQKKSVRLCDAQTGKILRTLGAHRDQVSSMTFSRDGKLFATGSHSEIKLWAVPSGTLLRTWEGHKEWVYGLAFSPDGKALVSASPDQTMKMWDVRTGELTRTFVDRSAVLLPGRRSGP